MIPLITASSTRSESGYAAATATSNGPPVPLTSGPTRTATRVAAPQAPTAPSSQTAAWVPACSRRMRVISETKTSTGKAR